MVEAISELPNLCNSGRVYLDLETTSGDPKLMSVNPWHNCSIAGICVTADFNASAWYIPVGHNDSHWNLPWKAVKEWATGLMESCNEWINHNVKYDAHVWMNAGLPIPERLVDTLTLAKIIDSDRMMKGGYGLTALCKAWLDQNIQPYDDAIQIFLKGCKSKDYGDCPADVMAEYGCQDVLSTRLLYDYIMKTMPKQCHGVADTEIALTPVLIDMERTGLHVDEIELKSFQLTTLVQMMNWEEELHDLSDFPIRPHVNDDCFDVLCNKYGLPILGRTESGNPSFDKKTLSLYLADPTVLGDSKLLRIVNTILDYRRIKTINDFFIGPYQEHAIDGVMHCTYNQAVRTGRMSCSQPNMQQLSKAAKRLIHPAPGYAFISADYSQIEFRLIVHYIENAAAIAAYAKDPDTDFHSWVAEMCGIARSPAKNVNFAMGFGGGRALILRMLSTNVELIGNLLEKAEGNHQRFKALCLQRAESVYRQYHTTLPELKLTSMAAARSVKSKGYVFNVYGRHRHLPERVAHIAFNAVIQSSAADLMKERTVATARRYDKFLDDMDVSQVASVHDETLFQAPIDVTKDPAVLTYIRDMMESPSIKLSVPIRVDIGVAGTNWADCTEKANVVVLPREL